MMKAISHYFSFLFSVVLFSCSLLFGCTTNSIKKSELKRSEILSIEERLHWRQTLDFPSHCENGIYEWDDETHPKLNFIDVSDEKFIVRSYCSLKPNEVNLYLVDKNKPHEKPDLLILDLPIEVENTNAEADWLENEAVGENWTQLTERIQLTVKYTSRMTSLVPGGMFINELGQLVIHKINIASGKCGMRSYYELKDNQAKLISFRAQSNCMGSNDVSRWKLYYESDLIPTDKRN